MTLTEKLVWSWLEQAGCKGIRKGSGHNLVSSCPFHKVKSGTQFSINTETGAYLCFSGSCGASGGIASFLVNALGWTWEKAIWATEQFKSSEHFTQQVVVPFEERGNVPTEEEQIIDEAILGLYDFAPKYILDRGFGKKILKKWEIGFDVDSSRATIPVRNEHGRLIGFSKRSIYDWQQPKYLHLNFHKGKTLFGLHRISRSSVWVTEGQLDTIALDQMRIESVSTMGTRVSEWQVDRLAKFRSVVLCLDNPSVDIDGKKTTLRIGEQLLRKMDPSSVWVKSEFPEGCKDAADVLKLPQSEQERFANGPLEQFDEWRFTCED